MFSSCAGDETVNADAQTEIPVIVEARKSLPDVNEAPAAESDSPPGEKAAPPDAETSDAILAAYRDPCSCEPVKLFFEGITGSADIAAVVLHHADKFDIPPALAFSLCWEESRYNPAAINRSNKNKTVDRGLFQLNSASFPDMSEEDFFDPELNARNGLSHLAWCLEAAGTEVAALAMYNAGLNRVRADGTPKRTLDYISRILERENEIEDFFLAVSFAEEPEEIAEVEEPAPSSVRLSLLTPLGGR